MEDIIIAGEVKRSLAPNGNYYSRYLAPDNIFEHIATSSRTTMPVLSVLDRGFKVALFTDLRYFRFHIYLLYGWLIILSFMWL